MFIWTTINGKQTFINDEELDPCEICGERIGTCEMNACNEEFGCLVCGAERASACRCDYVYDEWAGK